MLLDGNGLIYRGYFALPPLTTSKGELVNAVFGFCSIVLRGIADIRPDYVAVAFDLQGPTFRHEQYAEYKATRQRMPDDLRDQFPKVREVVKALRIPVYELAGYEADDVIGTITVDAERRGLDTTIVTGDLDMLQLVTDHTRLMTTRSGVENTILYDPARIAERFDLVPGQMIDYKALKGDPTDNIPGVPGVGEKTAAKLIREFGTLEALYERIDEVKPDKLRDKLVEHRDAVFMGKDLSTIVRDLPVDFDLEAARLGDYDRETVIRLFREYEFRSLIERLPAMTGEIGRGRGGSAARASRPTARCRPHASPGRRDRPAGARRARSGHRPRVAVSSSRSISMPWRRPRPPDGDGSGGPAPAVPTPTRARDRGRRPADRAGRRHQRSVADRGPRRRPAIASLEPWLAAQAAVGIGLLLDDPRPRRGVPLALAVAGTDGRTVAVEGPDDAATLRAAPRPARDPGRRARGQAASSSRASPTIPTRPPRPSPSIPRSPPTSSMPPCAARPSPTSWPSSSTSSCRRSSELDSAGAGRPRGAVRDRRPRAARAASRRRRPRPAVRRARAPAHRGAGADGGDRRRPRPRGARRAGPGVRDRDLAARVGDLPRRRPRVQPRQPQAARADPVLRAQPAQGQADQDRLLDRRLGARGPAPGPSDDRQAPRVADLHEAALDVRRCAADA